MMQATLAGPRDVRLDRVAVPCPGAGELLVRVRAANTCGTDLKAYLRGHPQIPVPGPFGHEYSGVVAQAGPGAGFEPGDAVMGVHSAPCLECRHCVRGQENLCDTVMETKVLGTYAEYVLLPRRIASTNVFLKPDGVDFAVAACLEPLACVAHGLAAAQPRPDDRVLVVGPGAVGLLFAAALRHMGLGPVTVAGRNKQRLALAESLGARTSAWADESGEYDLVIECTGNLDVWERSHTLVGKGGTLVLFGGCPAGTEARFGTGRLHYSETRVVSPFHFTRADVRQAREWLLEPSFPAGAVLSGERSLQDAARVFADLEQGVGIKYTFVP
jgi:L-iditol 2-dehydrogenase